MDSSVLNSKSQIQAKLLSSPRKHAPPYSLRFVNIAEENK